MFNNENESPNCKNVFGIYYTCKANLEANFSQTGNADSPVLRLRSFLHRQRQSARVGGAVAAADASLVKDFEGAICQKILESKSLVKA